MAADERRQIDSSTAPSASTFLNRSRCRYRRANRKRCQSWIRWTSPSVIVSLVAVVLLAVTASIVVHARLTGAATSGSSMPGSLADVNVAISPGAVSTFAGAGVQGYSQGLSSAAEFEQPGAQVIVQGTLVVADDDTLREVNTSTGAVSYLAGTPGVSGCVDSTSPGAVELTSNTDLATDGTYIYSLGDQCNTLNGYSSDTIRATSFITGATTTVGVTSCAPKSLTVGADGRIYYVCSNVLYSMSALSGAVTNTALTSQVQWIAADSSGLWMLADDYDGNNDSELQEWSTGSSPTELTSYNYHVAELGNSAFVSAGEYLYAADYGRIFQLNKSTGQDTVIGGNLDSGFSNGTGADAWFTYISGLSSDGSSLYVSDADNYRIRQIEPGTSQGIGNQVGVTGSLHISHAEVQVFAGSGRNATTDGTGLGASFESPAAVTAANGEVFSIDSDILREVSESSGAVKYLSWNSSVGGCTDSVTPSDVAGASTPITTDGYYLYSFMPQCYGNVGAEIRRTSVATGATSVVGLSSALYGASEMAIGPDHNLYWVDSEDGILSEMNLNTGVYTQATVPNLQRAFTISADSTGLWVGGQTAADEGNEQWTIEDITTGSSPSIITSFSEPGSLYPLISAGGTLYGGTNSSSVALDAISETSGAETFLAGSTAAGSRPGVGSGAGFTSLNDIAFDSGSLWIADGDGHVLDRVYNAPSPSSASLIGGTNPSLSCAACAEAAALNNDQATDPVDVQTGDYNHTYTDFDVNAPGLPLLFTRTYSSDPAALTTNGPFGYGWSFSYGLSLSVSGSTATIRQENGSVVTFTEVGSSWSPTDPATRATLSESGSTWMFTRSNQTTFTFNSQGQLTAEASFDGDPATTITYSGNTEVITADTGVTLTATTSGGHIVQVADNSSPVRTVTYSYDAGGDLTSVIDLLGGTTTFTYSSSHQLDTICTPTCNQSGATPKPVLTNNYYSSGAAAGLVSSQVDQLGRSTGFQYTIAAGSTDPAETTITSPTGNTTQDTFANSLLMSSTNGAGTAQAATWTYAYDPTTDAVTETVDPAGHESEYFFDSAGNIAAQVDPLGRVTAWTYNTFGEPTTVTPPATYGGATATTTLTYNSLGDLTATSMPFINSAGTQTGARTTTNTYTNTTYPSLPTSFTDPGGYVWHYAYNNYGELTTETAPQNTDTTGQSGSYSPVTRWSYSAIRGYVIGVLSPRYTAANPNATTCTPPAAGCAALAENGIGEVTKATDGDGNAASYTYNVDGNLLTTTDPAGNITTNGYDAADELTSSTDASGTSNAATWATSYTPDGLTLDQTNPLGAVTAYAYDPLDHLTSTTDPDGRTTSYSYDSLGNLVAEGQPGVTNCTASSTADGCTVRTYDADSELTSVSYHDSSTPNVSAVSYDGDGRMTSMTDGTGTSAWNYGSGGWLDSESNGAGATISYGHDSRGDTTSIKYPGSDGTVTQTFDNDQRERSVTDWAGNVTNFSYDPDGDPATTTDPTPSTNPVIDTETYDNADNIAGVATTQGSTSLEAFTYTRDPDSLVKTVTGTGNVGTPANNSYGYNQRSQLTSTTATTDGYDAAGDPTNLSGITQSFDTSGQLCWSLTAASPAACGSTPTGATTYGYNSRGDLTAITPAAAQSTTLGYTQENELDSWTSGVNSDSYAYNGLGERESKVVGGVTQQFTYDDDTSTLLSDGTHLYLYTQAGQPLEQETVSAGTTLWYHADQHGDTRMLTTTTGTVAGTATYGSYGATTATTGTTTPLGYGGGYTDADTRLIYLDNRYYDPATAEFLTVDPLNATTQSRYLYVDDNPLNYTDPTGLEEQPAEPGGGELGGAPVGGAATGGATGGPADPAPEPGPSDTAGADALAAPCPFGSLKAQAEEAIVGAEAGAGDAASQLPENAQGVLKYVKENSGAAPPGYVGGGTFYNNEGLLPSTDADGNPITYREYDTNPYQKGVNRGTERLVVGSNGSTYYTNDHYQSFTQGP
jgi:RHS repeat-associated protein